MKGIFVTDVWGSQNIAFAVQCRMHGLPWFVALLVLLFWVGDATLVLVLVMFSKKKAIKHFIPTYWAYIGFLLDTWNIQSILWTCACTCLYWKRRAGAILTSFCLHTTDVCKQVTYIYNIRNHSRKPLCLTNATLLSTIAIFPQRLAIAISTTTSWAYVGFL